MPFASDRKALGMVRRQLKPLVLVLCALPLAWLLARAFGLAGARLGPNPIDEIMDRLGEWGLRLLLATLLVSPLAVELRKPRLVGLRRMLGLYAFAYLSLHFLNWLVLDQWFGIRRARGRRSRANATARLEAHSTTAAG